MTPVRAWIGLGSNLDDPPAQLQAALAALERQPGVRMAVCSGFYRTAPVGPADQPEFCNAVAGLETSLEPLALLDALQAIERAQGRRRLRPWGERTLDLDLLLYGRRRIEHPRLRVPHPRLHERAFVLIPLTEVAPDVTVPGRGSAAALAAEAGSAGVVPWGAA